MSYYELQQKAKTDLYNLAHRTDINITQLGELEDLIHDLVETAYNTGIEEATD